MKNGTEILQKLLNIETTIEEIYKEIIKIKKENEKGKLEQIHIMTRIENIADFIETRYNIVVEEKEKFITETMENTNIMWYKLKRKN